VAIQKPLVMVNGQVQQIPVGDLIDAVSHDIDGGTATTVADRIQLRRALAANWTSVNPILAHGEMGLELDTYSTKVGDGTTAWNLLPYYTPFVISDGKGNVRSIPLNSQTAAYILAASDGGKVVSITTGGVTVNDSLMSAGDVVTIYNNSASSQVITQGTGVTLQWAGQTSSTTGSRTLGLYGIATILFLSPSSAIISGGGLS
jgi:hypothetical protein